MYGKRMSLKWNMLFSNLQAILQWGNQTPRASETFSLIGSCAPAHSAGRGRTLFSSLSAHTCLFLKHTSKQASKHAHTHTHTHTHKYHEASRCLKPFCGLWQAGGWKFADFTPWNVTAVSSEGTGCLNVSIPGSWSTRKSVPLFSFFFFFFFF